eukprot:gene6523-biopygen5312
MADTRENKKIEEESCTDDQEEFTHGIERMDIDKDVVPGATHIAYYEPVINIASGEAPITIGNIEQGTTRTWDKVGTVLENVPGNSEVTTGSAMFAYPSIQDVSGDKEAVVSKPQSANDFSGLRERYRKECAKHEVSCVEHGYFKPLNVEIQDFAVILRIREEKRNPAAEKTSNGVINGHIESLKDLTQNIEVGELLNMLQDDDKERIFFVGGVAGIGKSVLAKRIAYDWSCTAKYRHVKCLYYITCRELNNFFQKSDKEIGIEKIEKYLKEKLKVVSIEDDKATLFLIDGLNELQKPDMIRAFTKSFVRFSLIEKASSFDDEEEISYQLITRLGDEIIRHEDKRNIVRRALNKLKNSNLGGTIGNGDAQNLIRDIFNKLLSDGVLLKVRFLADCFVASDEVSDVKFLEELLKSIKPSSSVEVKLNAFDQSNLLSILKLATGNEVTYSEIKNAFSGIEFRINGLREMEILDYARWIDIDVVYLNDINHFTEDQSMLVHRNVAFCGRVWFYNCKVPLFTTNADESTTAMKLRELAMERMKFDQSDVSSAANLIGLAEWVRLADNQVGATEFEKIMEKVFEIKPRRLKEMRLFHCPLVNRDLKRKMKENGVGIYQSYKQNNGAIAIGLNRTILAIMDKKFIVISNAPANQVEANKIKQKFADEIGCPVFVNITLWKYDPRVAVVLLTDEYEECEQRKDLVDFTDPWTCHSRIIAVKLDSDFQPRSQLDEIASWGTCICWTDETNFETNFAKVKEEINAEFPRRR